MSLNLADADRALAAAEAAGVILQVGFNRRFDRGFAAAHEAVTSGAIGSIQLMRSLTRDPGLANPAAVPPWTIFLQTLIHDFDTLLWLNPGADPVEVYATADALVAPDFKNAGLLDTAVVVITFDNGARAVAEANFSAAYGYDVRGEVFGSDGMVTVGDGARSSAQLFTSVRLEHRHRPQRHRADARRVHRRVRRVRRGDPRMPSALRHRRRRPACARRRAGLHRVGPDPRPSRRPYGRRGGGVMAFQLAVCSEMVFTDLPLLERIRRIDELGFAVEIWDWTVKDIDALVATGATFSSMTGYIRGNLTDPDGADELLATAEQSIPVAARLGIPRLNLHGTGLGEGGIPVKPVEIVTGEMWLAAEKTLTRIARTRRTRRGDLRPREPQHCRRSPRNAVRQSGGLSRAGRGGRQPCTEADARPVPRPDRRGEPDRAPPPLRPGHRRDPSGRRTGPVRARHR